MGGEEERNEKKGEERRTFRKEEILERRQEGEGLTIGRLTGEERSQKIPKEESRDRERERD